MCSTATFATKPGAATLWLCFFHMDGMLPSCHNRHIVAQLGARWHAMLTSADKSKGGLVSCASGALQEAGWQGGEPLKKLHARVSRAGSRKTRRSASGRFATPRTLTPQTLGRCLTLSAGCPSGSDLTSRRSGRAARKSRWVMLCFVICTRRLVMVHWNASASKVMLP